MLEYETPQILSLGVLNVDFVMELGPRVGGEKMGKQISISAGGHGCSPAIAAVRCGVPAAAIGRVGSDAFGQQIISTLQAEHVNCDFLTQTDNAHSGLATIIEEAGLDNVFIDFLGANFQLTNEDIDQCLSAVEQAKLVIIHMGPAAMDVATHMIELADRCHTPVLVNPTAYADIPDHLWEKVDYLVLNMSQAAGLCGLKEENSKTARIAASTFGGRVRKAVIVHMDGNGVLIAQDGILRTLDQGASYQIVDYSGATPSSPAYSAPSW
ncbi:MAG: PfkB family carbohydrate kinase [Lawsonibacter sp.]